MNILRAIRFSASYDLKLSDGIKSEIKGSHVLQPIFDYKENKQNIGEELNLMLSDRASSLRAIEIMTELDVIDKLRRASVWEEWFKTATPNV
jgi:tRNA nucleotidyltransferase/poly(A) polymerase